MASSCTELDVKKEHSWERSLLASKHKLFSGKSRRKGVAKKTKFFFFFVEHTKDQSQPLNTFKVGMLNRHNTSISKQLLWVIVDKLPKHNNNDNNNKQNGVNN